MAGCTRRCAVRTKDLAELLKVLRRMKVGKFQMEGNSLAVEFLEASSPEQKEDAIGFRVEQEEDEE